MLLDKAITALDNRKSPSAETEDDVFCKHLAFQLKGLPDQEKKYAKFKIQELIFNLQYSGMNYVNMNMQSTSRNMQYTSPSMTYGSSLSVMTPPPFGGTPLSSPQMNLKNPQYENL